MHPNIYRNNIYNNKIMEKKTFPSNDELYIYMTIVMYLPMYSVYRL